MERETKVESTNPNVRDYFTVVFLKIGVRDTRPPEPNFVFHKLLKLVRIVSIFLRNKIQW